jgi:hypothetical protein
MYDVRLSHENFLCFLAYLAQEGFMKQLFVKELLDTSVEIKGSHADTRDIDSYIQNKTKCSVRRPSHAQLDLQSDYLINTVCPTLARTDPVHQMALNSHGF